MLYFIRYESARFVYISARRIFLIERVMFRKTSQTSNLKQARKRAQKRLQPKRNEIERHIRHQNKL